MKFEPGAIVPQLDRLGDCHSLVVAYSGGLDSTVLLHALVELRNSGILLPSLKALHVNHGLSPAADRWQTFCKQSCARLAVEFDSVAANVTIIPGRSLEEVARDTRYQIFSDRLTSDDCLLMAHHLDDEVENLLLRLTRGAGPGGLAGMPDTRSLGESKLLRPLLNHSRESLLQYARHHDLQWVEDDSNSNTEFDRNFWRRDVLPLVDRRFPGFRESWRKSMQLCGEADQLLQELAARDLPTLTTSDSRVLRVESLLALGEPRQRNVLRYWMVQLGFPVPGWQLMQRLTAEILRGSNAVARLECPAGLVQRFGKHLALMNANAAASIPARQWHWNPRSDPILQLDDNGSLYAAYSSTADPGSSHIRIKATAGDIEVRYRQEGERCRLTGRPNRSVKKIMQDSNRPPWLRSRQPLVCIDSRPICIPGIGVCDGYLAEPHEPGLELTWQPPDLLYAPD